MENGKKIFRTRISVLIIVILLIPIVDIIFSHKLPNRELYLLGLVYFFVFLTIAGIRYVISNNKLSLKLFWIIPFGSANIVSIKRTYNPLSSLSFSFGSTLFCVESNIFAHE